MTGGDEHTSFHSTQWHFVVRARGDEGTVLARAALESLCRIYWYPLYAFARRRGRSPHDAQDLTQGFFAYALEKDLFSAADPSLGKLRTFLLTAFTRYIHREDQRFAAQKRGGGHAIFSLDEEFDDGETRYRQEPTTKVTPEEIFAHSWALAILAAAKAWLQKQETAAGRGAIFESLATFLEADREGAVSYESLAAKLALSPEALRKAVSRLRERYRVAVRQQIAETLNAPDDREIEEEMRFLRAALQSR